MSSALLDLDNLLEELAVKDNDTAKPAPKKIEVRDSADLSREWKELDALVNQYDKEKNQNKTSSATQPLSQPPQQSTQPKGNEPKKTGYFVAKKSPAKEVSKEPAKTQLEPVSPPPPPLPPRDDELDVHSFKIEEKSSSSSRSSTSNPPYIRTTAKDQESEPPREAPSRNSGGSVIKGHTNTTPPTSIDNTKKENKCEKCQGIIQGECTVALGKTWHKEHFVCSTCGKGIIGDFYDHNNSKSINCKSCAEKVFVCVKCNLLIEGEYYVTKEGKFHSHCVEISPCFVCKQKIIGVEMIALGKFYHPECFKCNECGSQLQQQFYLLNENPICKSCSDKIEPEDSPQCTKCSMKIHGGSFVNYKAKPYHNECFICGNCSSILPLDNFYLIKGQPHCQKCANS